MSAILSAQGPVSDIVDGAEVEVVDGAPDALSAEEDALISASLAFYRWWEELSHVTRCEIQTDHAHACFTAGYLAMAREIGHLPKGDAP